ncbi:endonuclease/exonuclease/phosphatase family protein [Roseivirga sp. BDSF3-8]|uniref:endonuclease/exonuclease/phosphatase family protein n=1 Tax=Roseivirga sp. BDSF3-8 TaxID=3241598 RepID=UPI003531E14C
MARKRIILSRTLKVFGFIMLPVTLAVFFSTYVPPDLFWPAGILALFIPLLLLIQVLLAIYWLFRRVVWILIPLSLLAIGYGHIRSTISLHASAEGVDEGALLTVLNYNTGYFQGKKDDTGAPAPKADVAESVATELLINDADVICLQKFVQWPHGRGQSFASRMRSEGYTMYFPAGEDSTEVIAGVAIFSRLPVTGSGEFELSPRLRHRAAWVDVVRGEDTVRVVNVHFPAINTTEAGPFTAKKDQTGEEIIANLRVRQKARTEELDVLLDFLAYSPYPVLICGDFNETPYSYTYRKLNAFYDNAFEEAGRGFGVTYLPFSPFLLRIDHQFYDDRLVATTFETMKDIKLADHYPIRASYRLSRDD